MNNYNSSSYYRANPYKQIGYMPPMAQKNRKSPEHYSQIPQGEQHFQPTAKKHYNQSYQNQIQNQNIMKAAQKMSPLQKQAMQRSYFRSLNSKDIQGSSTNTLISKAVKNKMKAQIQLQRRKQIEKETIESEQLYKQQIQNKRKRDFLQQHQQVMRERYQRQSHPTNYHTQQHQHSQQPQPQQYLYIYPSQQQTNQKQSNVSSQQNTVDQRKRRQSQLLKLAQQRKNYAIVDFPSLYNNKKQQCFQNNSAFVQRQPNYHQKQLQKRRKTQLDADNFFDQEQKIQQNQPQHTQHNQQHHADDNAIKNQQEYEQKYKDSLDHHSNSYYNNTNNRPTQNSRKYNSNQNYHMIQKDEIRKYQNYNLPSSNFQPKYNPNTDININHSNQQIQQDIPLRQLSIDKLQYNLINNNNPINPNNFDNLHHGNKINQNSYNISNNYNIKNKDKNTHEQYNNNNNMNYIYKNRQQLRRHNPTFLSYGSPTFAIASRNVMQP